MCNPEFAILFAVIAGFAASACDSAGRDGQASGLADLVDIRDSVGIRIVDHSREVRSLLSEWDISERPGLEIGEVDGQDAYLFSGPLHAVVLSTGEVVVADVASREIRFFDENGVALRSVGRIGRGPGEFSVISGLRRIQGDTLLVRDETGGRITWLDSSGVVVRLETRPPPRTFHEGVMLADGSRAIPVFHNPQPPQDGVVWRPSADLALVAHPTGIIQALGRFRGMEQVVGSLAGVPFPRSTVFATSGLVRSVAIGDTETFDVAVYDLTDSATVRLRLRLRRTEGPDPITRDDIAGWREAVRDRYSESPMRAAIDARLAESVPQKFRPAYADLFLDTSGHLWVEEFTNDSKSARPVTIFSPSGIPVGRTDLPRDVEVLDIGTDYLLGRWQDEFGVSYIRKYSLTR